MLLTFWNAIKEKWVVLSHMEHIRKGLYLSQTVPFVWKSKFQRMLQIFVFDILLHSVCAVTFTLADTCAKVYLSSHLFSGSAYEELLCKLFYLKAEITLSPQLAFI